MSVAMITNSPEATAEDLQAQLATLRAAFRAEPYPTLEVRKDRLRRAIDVLLRYEQKIVDAIQVDFGGRPEALSLIMEVMSPVRSLRYSLKHVAKWMRPERRSPEFPMGLIGGSAKIFHQPLGVVGVVAPWNAPVALVFSPLASILAAGNRAFVKPSELVPETAALIEEMIKSAFDKTEVQVVQGGATVAQNFTSLPFDHLLFTGSPRTARHVMAAAARNLVPVTLELGGKSPAIIAKGSDLNYAADKIGFGKFANGGQVCMAPDFALVHRSDLEGFATAMRATVAKMYPNVRDNADFTSIHLASQRKRLAGLVREVAERGGRVEVLSGESVASLGESPRFSPVLLIDPPTDTEAMRTEVFGPVLPIVPYDTLEGVVSLMNGLERPLALYHLGGTPAEKDYIVHNTFAGGMTFDDVMLHPFMQDMAFGGVGESGMGRYLGYDGFKALSNNKGVVQRPWIDVSRYIAPPFTSKLSWALRRAIRF